MLTRTRQASRLIQGRMLLRRGNLPMLLGSFATIPPSRNTVNTLNLNPYFCVQGLPGYRWARDLPVLRLRDVCLKFISCSFDFRAWHDAFLGRSSAGRREIRRQPRFLRLSKPMRPALRFHVTGGTSAMPTFARRGARDCGRSLRVVAASSPERTDSAAESAPTALFPSRKHRVGAFTRSLQR